MDNTQFYPGAPLGSVGTPDPVTGEVSSIGGGGQTVDNNEATSFSKGTSVVVGTPDPVTGEVTSFDSEASKQYRVVVANSVKNDS